MFLALKNLSADFGFAPKARLPATASRYQEDFTTPGISPFNANALKHKRHTPNLRRNARGRPHRLQRLCCRVENFGFFLSFTRFAVVAICLSDPLTS